MQNNKKIICITGPAGSGKTTLCKLLQRKGYTVINVDELGHKALTIAKRDIVKEFGSNILDANGRISRAKLRSKLKSIDDIKRLEKITHPIIRKLLTKELTYLKDNKIIIDVAIPYTLKIQKECDLIIRITAPPNILKERLVKRGVEEGFAEIILKKQETERGEADFVLENTSSLTEFLEKAVQLIMNI